MMTSKGKALVKCFASLSVDCVLTRDDHGAGVPE